MYSVHLLNVALVGVAESAAAPQQVKDCLMSVKLIFLLGTTLLCAQKHIYLSIHIYISVAVYFYLWVFQLEVSFLTTCQKAENVFDLQFFLFFL